MDSVFYSGIAAIIESAGPIAALIVFFIYRDYRREQRMTDRLTAIEDFQREILLKLVADTAEVIRETNTINSDVLEVLEAIRKRPCALMSIAKCKEA